MTINYERSDATSQATDFFGALKSPNSQCERGRQVSLKKVKKGRDRTVGSTISKRSGKWRIREARARGRYYAKTAKRTLSGPGVVCQAGRSKTIRV